WLLPPFLDKARWRQPSIFIAGSLDGVLLMAADEVKSMHENVPNLSGKHIIDGAGHWIQQERPEEVNKLLVDFAEANRSPRQLFT
ncbi:MAG TPA: alpha/beta hydrolase, partial [Afipia sp.]|nr:alpha/beta hydrolase [Afipia sp.]